jgi:Tol biopolymer transport system component
VDSQTGDRLGLTHSTYPGKAYWSPDGKLAFADRAGGSTRLVIFDPVRGTRRVVARHVCGDALVEPWSPDGRALALPVSPPRGGCNGHGGPEVAVADPAGGRMRRITHPRTTPVTWSRDGSGLLLAARDDSGPGSSRLVDPRTGKGAAVLSPIESLLAPGSWSKGRRFYAALAIYAADSAQSVVIVEGSLRRIRRTIVFGQQYAWSPRRQWLAVSEEKRIRVLDAETGRTVAVIPVQTLYGLGVQSLTWDPGGRSLLAVAAPSLGHD